MELDIINDTFTPITEKTFEKNGWEKKEHDNDGDTYHWWELPLPSDNPSKNARCLISTMNDTYKDYGLRDGEFLVEIKNFTGLGMCMYEEDIEDLYMVLTGQLLNET